MNFCKECLVAYPPGGHRAGSPSCVKQVIKNYVDAHHELATTSIPDRPKAAHRLADAWLALMRAAR